MAPILIGSVDWAGAGLQLVNKTPNIIRMVIKERIFMANLPYSFNQF
jgi:hypothetical protein